MQNKKKTMHFFPALSFSRNFGPAVGRHIYISSYLSP